MFHPSRCQINIQSAVSDCHPVGWRRGSSNRQMEIRPGGWGGFGFGQISAIGLGLGTPTWFRLSCLPCPSQLSLSLGQIRPNNPDKLQIWRIFLAATSNKNAPDKLHIWRFFFACTSDAPHLSQRRFRMATNLNRNAERH